MIRPDALLSYVRSQPFRPFRIKMLSGAVYEIRHPEMIRVGRDYFVFFHATPPDAPAKRFETISLIHVENLHHFEQPAAPGTDAA